jgi:putative membrane protein insertion efficiency factor
VPYTSNLPSGILAALHAASCFGSVNILNRLLLLLLTLYKRGLSPLLGQRCRFYPSCSDYARVAVARFGPLRGSLLAGWRLMRCQPLCTGGEDPVPEHFHFRRCHTPGDSTHVH